MMEKSINPYMADLASSSPSTEEKINEFISSVAKYFTKKEAPNGGELASPTTVVSEIKESEIVK